MSRLAYPLLGFLLSACQLGPCSGGIPEEVLRAQTTEARLNLMQMAQGAEMFASLERMAPGVLEPGAPTMIMMGFPESAPRTPATVPCGDAVLVDGTSWSAPGWLALRFQPTGRVRYAYQFDSQGEGLGATFTASAFGDLDCDGVLSTFRQTGRMVSGGLVQLDEVTVENELE